MPQLNTSVAMRPSEAEASPRATMCSTPTASFRCVGAPSDHAEGRFQVGSTLPKSGFIGIGTTVALGGDTGSAVP
eukprot:365321-Prymnesium_polylepis.1